MPETIGDITILSYNLLMHKAYGELPDLVEEHAVDVLCLQECRPGDVAPEIGSLTLARSDSLGRLGLAMYVRRGGWRMVRDACRGLPNALYEKSLRMSDRTRLQMLELESVEDEDVRVVAANTHIAHLMASGVSRRKQAVQAAKMTLAFANGLPVALSGDFNLPFAEEKLVSAMELAGLEHAASPQGALVTYKKWPRQTFDRMFYAGMSLQKIDVLPFGNSDHAPIIGKLALLRPGKG